MHVALASCRVLPEPDPDARPLSAGLARAGLDAEVLAWDDPEVDWSRAPLTLLRSTWNYPQRPDDFLAWAERTSHVTELWNALEVVRWNVHKRYLLELEKRNVAIAPTVLVPRGDRTTLRSILAQKGWKDAVVKPAISAASFGTLRVTAANHDEGEAHLASLVAERDVLVQRYLSAVEGYGERALVWVDGKLTHAVRKSPRFAGAEEKVSEAVPIRPDEAQLAERAVAAVGVPLRYARIDVAPGPDGPPVIMELELVEPSLFFEQGPEALERLIAAVKRHLAAR